MCPTPGSTTTGNSRPLLTFMVITLILLAGGVKVARAQPVLYGQLALRQGAGAQVARFGVGAQHGHVAPRKAFFVGLGQVVGNGFRLCLQGGQLDDEGLLPLAPTAHGFEQGDAVVIGILGCQQVSSY